MTKGARCVLVAEDSGLVALELDMILADAGLSVTIVASLAAAQEALARMAFPLALLDFQLSDGDAATLALGLRDAGCQVAIITGFSADALPMALNGFPCFRKPVDPVALTDWIAATQSAFDPGTKGG